MPACEKCWGDAFIASKISGRSQPEEYHRLLDERSESPCTPEQQAGQFAERVMGDKKVSAANRWPSPLNATATPRSSSLRGD
jgi:hypothetical protein